MSATFALLVPVKALGRAKSRLAVDQAQREQLMRAFAHDAVEAARSSPRVHRVYVVCSEPLHLDDVDVIEDEGDGDLNRALRHAERQVRLAAPDRGVAAMCADLPALRTADLTEALSGGLSPRWFVADATGAGTTLLAAGAGVELQPHFGVGSAARHEQSGAVPLRGELPTLRADVDTDADLDRARALGLGPRTRAVLGRHHRT